MSATTITTQGVATLTLRGAPPPSPSTSPGTIKDADQKYNAFNADGTYKYEEYLPSFDQDYKLPPLELFEHVDPGRAALTDPEPRSFLNGARESDLTPRFGSEIEGIQLSKLDARAKSQLALYVAQRGVVVFREQDFQDQPAEWLLHEWGSSFGRLHVHPTSGQPKNHPEFHLVYRDSGSTFNFEKNSALTTSVWHSDVTYEQQPPGLTTLFLFDSPPSGGDTAYASQVEAYNRLSPSFRSYLETLSVVHSGVEQAEFSRAGNRGGVVKREPVENVHPLVRTHPLTGQKALFVNKQFSRRIVGLKTDESDAILNLLYNHIATGIDFHVRARWKPRSVVLWDNRVTAHSAIVDFDGKQDGRRHGARITPQAEQPYI